MRLGVYFKMIGEDRVISKVDLLPQLSRVEANEPTLKSTIPETAMQPPYLATLTIPFASTWCRPFTLGWLGYELESKSTNFTTLLYVKDSNQTWCLAAANASHENEIKMEFDFNVRESQKASRIKSTSSSWFQTFPAYNSGMQYVASLHEVERAIVNLLVQLKEFRLETF